jgi:hypothetical protein
MSLKQINSNWHTFKKLGLTSMNDSGIQRPYHAIDILAVFTAECLVFAAGRMDDNGILGLGGEPGHHAQGDGKATDVDKDIFKNKQEYTCQYAKGGEGTAGLCHAVLYGDHVLQGISEAVSNKLDIADFDAFKTEEYKLFH